MRVLKVHSVYRQSGGEAHTVATEAALLASAGHAVDEYAVENPEGLLPSLPKLLAAPWNPASAIKTYLRARRIRPDVVHVHNTWFSLSPSVIAAIGKLQLPVVMTLHNYGLICPARSLYRDGRVCTDCVGSHPWHGTMHRCYRNSRALSALAGVTISLNRALGTWSGGVDTFIAGTEATRSHLVEGGLPADRIAVVPSAVDDTSPRSTRPSASNDILYVGRLVNHKGIDVLLEAWRNTHTRSLRLVIIGDGPERSRVERQAPPNVDFAGHLTIEEARRRMLQARALVFPSVWHEPFGRVVVEAIAAGLPVVSSRVGVGADVGRYLGAEWLVPPGDVARLSTAIAGLQDSASVDSAGALGRDLYESQYSPRVTIPRLVEVLRSAVEGSPHPSRTATSDVSRTRSGGEPEL